MMLKTPSLLSCIGLAILLGFSSCDKIEQAHFLEDVSEVNENCELIDFQPRTIVVQKVLLQKFTAQLCGFCPGAALKGKQIKEKYPERVIPVTIHCSSLADPETEGEKYLSDYRTEAGAIYNETFGMSESNLPSGMVNQIGVPTSTNSLNPNIWEILIKSVLEKSAEVDIQIKASYQSDINEICVNTYSEFLQTKDSQYRMIVLLTENNIVDWQKNSDAADPNYESGDVEHYTHQHVLRTHLGNVWGTNLEKSERGDTQTDQYSIELKDEWNKEELEIVAYIYDAETHEVLQAESVKVE